MIKPLLRTIPTLSGNIKLVCTLLDYKQNGDVIETNIRGAKMMPISSNLFQKSLVANLLNSSWEYDVKKFYIWYADYFYNSNYPINKKEIEILDMTSNVSTRNTDFEYGFKRVSYQKSGCQFACFAPIYIESVDDIPAYFLIEAKFVSGKRSKTINIKVNIGDNKESKENYIWHYINRYASRINNDVAFMDNNQKSVIYYGIDVINGGFTKKIDPTVMNIFNVQIPIQMFDSTISDGFRRNKMCLSQVLPLCFNFNVYDLLSELDKIHFYNSDIVFSGAYYDKNGNKLDMYDFSWDYDTYNEQRMLMNPFTGSLVKYNGKSSNIMDSEFPALYDKRIIDYQFSNKLTAVYNRWKLKYSTDEYPYITNMSWAFSNNQDSNYKYKEFPVTFLSQAGLAIVDHKLSQYNLIFPIDSDKKIYDEYTEASAKKYKDIMDNYCLNWFDVVDITDTNWKNTAHWSDTDNGFVYNNGILYDLNAIYNKYVHISDDKKIDKFGLFVYPDTSKINAGSTVLENMSVVSHVVNTPVHIEDGSIKDSTKLFDINNYTAKVEDTVIFEETTDASSTNTDIYVNAVDLTNSSWYDINTIYAETDININGKSVREFIKDKIKDALAPILVAPLQYTDNIDGAVDDFINNIVFEHIFNKLNLQLPIYRNRFLFDDDDSNIKQEYMNDPAIKEFIKNLKIAETPTFMGDLCDANGDQVFSPTTDNLNKSYSNTLYTSEYFTKPEYLSPVTNDIIIKRSAATSADDLFECIIASDDGPQPTYNQQDINKQGTITYKLITNVITALHDVIVGDIYSGISDVISSGTLPEYELLPIAYYNKQQYANNIVVRRTTSFGKLIGSKLTVEQAEEEDFNYLWAHPYNLEAFLGQPIWNNISSKGRVFYARIQSLNHLKVYITTISNKLSGSAESKLYKEIKVITTDKTQPIKYKYTLITTGDKPTIDDIEGINYDAASDMFYATTAEGNSYFNIVEKTTFYPITREIWEFLNIDADDPTDYKDMYIYRPWLPVEHDEKCASKMFMEISDGSGILTECDGILNPCFNIVYLQDRAETVIYKNWILDNIKEVTVTPDDARYRYATDNEKLFVKVDSTSTLPDDIKLYKRRNSETVSELINNSDYGKYYDDFSLNTWYNTEDGTVYGYILIKVNMDITSDVLNIRGFLDSSYYDGLTSNTNIEDINSLMYVKYINGVDVLQHSDYIIKIFKQLAPFIRTNLLKNIADIPIIVKPSIFDLNILYRTSLIDNSNGSDEVNLIFDKGTTQVQKNQVLQRYTNAIVPYIRKTSVIVNQYVKKFKSVQSTLLDTGRFNSIGDSPIYKETQTINVTPKVRVYSNKDTYTEVVPYEFKHYNTSTFVNLKPEYTVKHNKYVDYNTLQNLESPEATLEVFSSLFSSFGEEEILFLFKKYNVLYDSTPVMLNPNQSHKLYSLTYKFILL